jgi:alpha-galactosidase
VGFKWVDVDDGYQIAEGDWEPNDRFPGGDKDMRRLTDAIHAHGLKAKLWWAPLAADPGSNILEKRPEMLLMTVDRTPQYITWWNSYYLSPVNRYTQEYTRDLVKRFMHTWNFDGLKMDGQHLNNCLPDYNRHSGLDYPEQAVEQMPMFFKDIYETAIKYKPNAVIQNCPCGTAMNFFNMPYMNQAVSSDPTSSWQIRLKGKVYRAIFDEIAYYADHVELSDNGDDFPTQIGIGAVVGSKFTWPRDNPDVQRSYLLTPEKEKLYKKWVGIYNDKMLSKGSYLGSLYDLSFDKPETHAIQKGDTIYYAFYADQWNGEPIELRGLEQAEYVVHEYTNDEQVKYTIDGKNPIIRPEFTGNYLIEVYLKR